MKLNVVREALTPSIGCRYRFRKAAGLFAGLGHLQPLLLATTNSHYLLDRFCMERCCSGEYVSRIVTSIIFMEILSIIVVRIVLYIVFTYWSKWDGTRDLNNHNEAEEIIRGIVGSTILILILVGYIQILYAFTSGGRKGHIHWFYASLLIQHFLNSLIAGSIGFWDVGLALWYLVTLPMAPIIIFFYQLIIHSWIRNNGPRNVEYLVVECQIVLATAISCIATIFWTCGYIIPIIPIELNLAGSLDSSNDNIKNINVQSAKPLIILTITGQSVNISVTGDSVTLKPGQAVKINLALQNLNTGIPDLKSVKVHSVTRTITLTGEYDQSVTITIDPVKSGVLENPGQAKLTLTGTITNGSLTSPNTGNITLKSEITLALEATLHSKGPDGSVRTVTLALTGTPTIAKSTSDKSVEITLEAADSAKATTVQVTGHTYTPHDGYCIYSVKDSSVVDNDNNKPDIWASGGKHVHATCYYSNSTTQSRLLCLSVYSGDKFSNNMFYGRDDTKDANTANENPWRVITNEADFIKNMKNLPALTSSDETSTLTGLGSNTEQYNRYFDRVLWNNWRLNTPTPTWAPLLMQGLSVGAVGSIFPNLIPKTLTCPKTTRTLTVINMFLVTIPHIFNVMLGDMDLLSRIGVGAPWEGGFHTVWLLYLIYALAILFAIFNVHYPEWALSSFLRNNTWIVFLMILFTDVLNESFNAISRAGICSQKSADTNKPKNHPCLHNKIACLMNLTYIPFRSSIL